jgi:hypothetical protein
MRFKAVALAVLLAALAHSTDSRADDDAKVWAAVIGTEACLLICGVTIAGYNFAKAGQGPEDGEVMWNVGYAFGAINLALGAGGIVAGSFVEDETLQGVLLGLGVVHALVGLADLTASGVAQSRADDGAPPVNADSAAPVGLRIAF